jgi:predicted transcriptional regulator
MDKAKKYRLAGVFLIVSILIVIAANFGFRISEDNLTQLIIAVIITSGTFYGVIISNKTNKQLDNIKTDVNKIDSKVQLIDQTIRNIDEKQIRMEVGMFDISETIKHKEEINELVRAIENKTADILENHYDICSYLKDVIILINDNISLVIKNQYEYGFSEFNTGYFKRKLTNKISEITEHLDTNQIEEEILKRIFESVNKNIELYINEVELIKNLENGTRRKHFKEYTFKLTKRITNQTINIYSKQIA